MSYTRLSVRAQAVTTALDHYEGIMDALDEVATDSSNETSCVEASSLHVQFSESNVLLHVSCTSWLPKLYIPAC